MFEFARCIRDLATLLLHRFRGLLHSGFSGLRGRCACHTPITPARRWSSAYDVSSVNAKGTSCRPDHNGGTERAPPSLTSDRVRGGNGAAARAGLARATTAIQVLVFATAAYAILQTILFSLHLYSAELYSTRCVRSARDS